MRDKAQATNRVYNPSGAPSKARNNNEQIRREFLGTDSSGESTIARDTRERSEAQVTQEVSDDDSPRVPPPLMAFQI